MPGFLLMEIARQYFLAREGLLKRYPDPWLVWTPPKQTTGNEVTHTVSTGERVGFEAGEALAFTVSKLPEANSFQYGITIGRAENNDVVLRHPEVSRFHAYLQQADGAVMLVDADSSNGTFFEGRRLRPRAPEPLGDDARLRFGQLEVRYLSPARFLLYLEGHIGR